jgi:hypothetical protein
VRIRPRSTKNYIKQNIRNTAKKDKTKNKIKRIDLSKTQKLGNKSETQNIKNQIMSLKKLTKTQEIGKKDYMNVFLLAKDIQAKNSSYDNTNFRKNYMNKDRKPINKIIKGRKLLIK